MGSSLILIVVLAVTLLLLGFLGVVFIMVGVMVFVRRRQAIAAIRAESMPKPRPSSQPKAKPSSEPKAKPSSEPKAKPSSEPKAVPQPIAPPAPPPFGASTPTVQPDEPTKKKPMMGGPSPMGDEFLRIFDDDELAENAATEVFTRIPGRALFDDDEDEDEPVFVSREKSTDSSSLPGKVVAEKKP